MQSNVSFEQNVNYSVFIFFFKGTSISPQLKPENAHLFFNIIKKLRYVKFNFKFSKLPLLH